MTKEEDELINRCAVRFEIASLYALGSSVRRYFESQRLRDSQWTPQEIAAAKDAHDFAIGICEAIERYNAGGAH